MKKLALIIFSLALSINIFATKAEKLINGYDLEISTGRIYEFAILKKVTLNGIYILHKDGKAFINHALLPEKIQKALEPEIRTLKEREKQKEEKAMRAEELQKSKKPEIKQEEVTEDENKVKTDTRKRVSRERILIPAKYEICPRCKGKKYIYVENIKLQGDEKRLCTKCRGTGKVKVANAKYIKISTNPDEPGFLYFTTTPYDIDVFLNDRLIEATKKKPASNLSIYRIELPPSEYTLILSHSRAQEKKEMLVTVYPGHKNRLGIIGLWTYNVELKLSLGGVIRGRFHSENSKYITIWTAPRVKKSFERKKVRSLDWIKKNGLNL
jgi:hypothetical protein